jgi:hypothetical protein
LIDQAIDTAGKRGLITRGEAAELERARSSLAMSFPKDKAPHSVRVLHSWIAAYAKRTGELPERIIRSVSYMVASRALERARDETGAPLFLIKGGVMIERSRSSEPTLSVCS